MSKSLHFSKGDILRGSKRGRDEAFHPIIYISEHDNDFFLGGMITHSAIKGNVALDDAHFESKGKLDRKPQFFVQQYLLKKHDWAPFEKVGKLSPEGIKHVLKHIEKTEPTYWDDYYLTS